ncbi:MAG: transpeptidase family protein [Bacteroidales bacterium]|nr:transpeptidase family protein [Bacteroidales bacterium]
MKKTASKAAQADGKPKKDRIGRFLSVLYVVFLIIAIFLILRIAYIQIFYKPDEKLARVLTPTSRKEVIEPVRGAILAEDGRLLAMSLPIYDIYMDCTVLKEKHANDREKGDSLEGVWLGKARLLSDGLAEILRDKTSDQYYELIRSGRAGNKKYVKICTGIERKEYNRLCELPLFNERQYSGGMIVEKSNIRKYPYGKLARRTIGFVRNNKNVTGNPYVGIEGKFNSYLHGQDGIQFLRKIDGGKKVLDNDSTYVKAVDGADVRTTLNIDIQDIADAAVREQVEENPGIEGGCAIIMEVKTGAIRAMVNLLRDTTTGRLEEWQNLAIGRLGEPGSVFKATTLMTALEDKKIQSLDDTIPTRHGNLRGFRPDVHIYDYEREHHTNVIPIIDGFEMSSNYVFRYLAIKHYGHKPKELLDRLYSYKLGEAFDFDIEGLGTPILPDPSSPYWSDTDLGSVAIGYSISETPLHIITFYNAIANKGKMMKPYLVEDVEKHGRVIEKLGPSVLNASICSPATADTLNRALMAVVEEGTAKRLKGARCTVAGKTGTARIALETGGYEGPKGHKNQGTFVGYFPAENPKYSFIVSIYSGFTNGSFYGGTLPAAAVRTIVDKMFAMDSDLAAADSTFRSPLRKTGQVPQMKPDASIGAKPVKGVVPDVGGLGLSDAISAIEAAGYTCSWSGIGHVKSQSPKAGAEIKEGSTVSIVLK